MSTTPGTKVQIHTTDSRNATESLKYVSIIYNITTARFEKWNGVAWVLHSDGVLDSGGDLIAPGGYKNIISFGLDNVGISLTNVLLGIQGDVILESKLPFAGSIVGMSLFSNVGRTAGTLTVEAFIAGAATGFTASLDAVNTIDNQVTQAKDLDAFAVGDSLQVKITTTATWAPITADIRVQLIVEI